MLQNPFLFASNTGARMVIIDVSEMCGITPESEYHRLNEKLRAG